MDKPKVKLTQEAQDMIDMFSELDEAQCNELAKFLIAGQSTSFMRTMLNEMVKWEDAKNQNSDQ